MVTMHSWHMIRGQFRFAVFNSWLFLQLLAHCDNTFHIHANSKKQERMIFCIIIDNGYNKTMNGTVLMHWLFWPSLTTTAGKNVATTSSSQYSVGLIIFVLFATKLESKSETLTQFLTNFFNQFNLKLPYRIKVIITRCKLFTHTHMWKLWFGRQWHDTTHIPYKI